MKKYFGEFIGAFFLVLTVIMTSNNPSIVPLAPFAVAGIYLAMIYAAGTGASGYFNPAITVALLMRGKLDRGTALYYGIVQLIAGVLAAAIGVYLRDCNGAVDLVARVNEQPICAVLGEFLGTFALTYVILQVKAKAEPEANPFYGLAIGFTLLAATYALGGLGGGVFNPALYLGGSVAGLYAWDDILVYLIGAFLGAAAASTAVQLSSDKDL